MGRVERLKEECLRFEEVEGLEELQHRAERYGTQRPHPALGHKTLIEGFEEARKGVSFS